MTILPILLAGGAGTRLWPLSSEDRPKQFQAIENSRTLFQDTLERCRGAQFDRRPIVVGSDHHRSLIGENLRKLGLDAEILLEPMVRNSCAAVAAGAVRALDRRENALLLVLAADHRIPDRAAFQRAVERGVADAMDGYLVTFGIRPSGTATGYGYIEPGVPLAAARRAISFVEKPDNRRARAMVERGFLWNSGNFLFRADVIFEELARHAETVLAAVQKSYRNRSVHSEFHRLAAADFQCAPSVSFDHAIMEKTDRAAVLAVDHDWSDIGNWDAVAREFPTDPHGNAAIGKAYFLDSSKSFVHSRGHLTALVGMRDTVVVANRDRVLVAHRDAVEDVKRLVEKLKKEGKMDSNPSLQEFRPWGNYERLDIGPGYQVKRITVDPGGILSLQKHQCRAEHWVVVAGEAVVTLGKQKRRVLPNESVYVPLGEVHRISNPGTQPLVLIEVQTGDYLGEDDILRLEDHYDRVAGPGREVG